MCAVLELSQEERHGSDVEGDGGVGDKDSVGEGEGGASTVRRKIPQDSGGEGHEAHHSRVQWHRGGSCSKEASRA